MKISEYLNNEYKSVPWIYKRLNGLLKYIDCELVLLPCPICGSSHIGLIIDTKSDGNTSYLSSQIICYWCGLRTIERCVDGYYGSTDTINHSINDWNTRVDN